jgi:kynurenine formamidase
MYIWFNLKRNINRQDLDTTVSVQDLENWEKKHGKIPNHAVVLLYTGQSKFYNDENKYFGREEGFQYPDTEHIHFPGFSAESAQWLVDER